MLRCRPRRPSLIALFVCATVAAVPAACGGGSKTVPAVVGAVASGIPGVEGPDALSADQMNALQPAALSPELDAPSPLPTSLQAHGSVPAAKTRSQKGLNWDPVLGAPAVAALTVSPQDGSLWGVAVPAGGKLDGAIYTNKGGMWQQFTKAAASSIAVDSQGSVYAVSRSTGGIYEFAAPAATPGPGASPLPASTWFPIGAHASSVTVGADGTPYVLGNANPTANNAVYRYGVVPLKTGFHWTQLKGAGVQIAASYDPNGEVVSPGVTFLPNGFFLVHSSGGIFYYNSAGAAPGFVKFPAVPPSGSAPASAGVAATFGGLYALAYPAVATGEKVWKFDYTTTKWSDQGVYVASGLASGVIPAQARRRSMRTTRRERCRSRRSHRRRPDHRHSPSRSRSTPARSVRIRRCRRAQRTSTFSDSTCRSRPDPQRRCGSS